MARYQVTVSYDGTDFFGSQRQGLKRTVQSELEKALTRIGWTGKSILLAGRTDAGVHANGQVAAFDLEWNHAPGKLMKAINSHLPGDLVVWAIRQVPASFHPRFDATSRTYRYRLFSGEVRDPLRERFVWRVWPAVDNPASLADLWLGTHDFSSFGSPVSALGNTRRSVRKSTWERQGEEWIFEIEADAFLYRMVRRLVFVQVAATRGRVNVNDLLKALDGAPEEKERAKRNLPAGLAAPNGLSLIHVKYDDQD
jgi:tRNA pseudouridine38-40 synthase